MIRLRRIINNTIISLLGQAVTWTSMLLLTIAYGHFLGAFKFGELYFAITFVSLVGIPVDSGYANQVIRDVAQEPSKALRYFSNILIIKLSTWFIIYPLILLVSWLLAFSMEVHLLVVICGFDLLWNAIASTFASLHNAFERTVLPVVGNILEKGLAALFGFLLLRSGAGVQVMALVLAGGSLVNVVWQALWFFRLTGTRFVIDPALIRKIALTNVPFLIIGVLILSFNNIDTVLLSLMTNSIVVGWYGAATRIFDTLNFLPIIVITTIMYPVFSKLSTTSDEGLKLAIEKSVNFLLFCGIPIATVLIVAAPNVIGFLYGHSGFTPSFAALQVLAPSLVFIYINYALITALLSRKKEGKISIMSAVALVLNLGLNIILIPFYQQMGAAIASAVTEILVFSFCVTLTPRHLRPFGSLRVAIKALIAGLAMALVILPLHTLDIFVILPIAMLVYLGASALLGTIPREDYRAVYRAMRKKAQTMPAVTARTETFLSDENSSK